MAAFDGGIQLSSITRDDSEEGLVSVYSSLEERQTTNNAKELNKEYKVAILVNFHACSVIVSCMQKAALLVKEGRDNEKFESTPEKKRAYIAYRILHNPFYYWTALILAVALMLMAAFEQPSTIYKRRKGQIR